MKTHAFILALVLGMSITSCSSGGGGDDEDPAATDDALIPALTADLTGWTFDVSAGAGAAIAVKDGTATVSVTVGGNDEADVQLATKTPVTLVNGKMYKLSLTATGGSGQMMTVAIGPTDKDGDPVYWKWSQICCDGTAQTITRVIKGGPADINLTISFGSYGDNGIDNDGAVYKISDITLENLGDVPTLSGSEILLDGNFSAGGLNWQTYYDLATGIVAQTSFKDDRLNLEITDSGTAFWQVHVRSKSWIKLNGGKSYRLSYTCNGKAGKSLNSTVLEEKVDGDGDGLYSIFLNKITLLNGTTQNESFTFTMPKDNTKVVVKMNAGYDTDDGINNDGNGLWIDDISLQPVD